MHEFGSLLKISMGGSIFSAALTVMVSITHLVSVVDAQTWIDFDFDPFASSILLEW
jgi:hypothetical protein